jgi:tetratricopeptide (TPR) repeat protein
MRLKLYFLLFCVTLISFVLHLSSIFVETAGNTVGYGDKSTTTSSDHSEKEDLAKQMFFEIRQVDDPTEKAVLYRKIVDECSGIELAEEALWRLSQLYLNDFDEPNAKEAIGCLERFIKSYPDSEWRSHVEFSLLGLYESEKLWKKVISLCEKIIEENPNMPSRLKEELLRRYRAAKNSVKS